MRSAAPAGKPGAARSKTKDILDSADFILAFVFSQPPPIDAIRTARRQRSAEYLCALGPRPVFEALKEVAAGRDLDFVLDRFARLDLVVVRALGGDRFPPPPVHAVPR